ncbi:MAG: hypothetical protein ACEPOW_09420 [Bacteroidales bacterium]
MSIQSKKFGTFGGVFTPSILTILGVIMYLRLGWVIGESGLFGALGIILLAHVISVSTGLSISSIATDKKVKTGGIYYMLSRSLGLPMGGAIGIALFIGTAFSISLYITGFTESFLSIDSIREYFHLTGSIEEYRIIGTIVLLLLGILAFISTSIAIKTQFIILGAIILSLISVFIGFFVNIDPSSVGFTFKGVSNGVPPAEVFAIFFPAVTGFTAGVAMSGDLANPKKAIPRGTIIAIVTGLVVYLALTVAFSYFVDQNTLINDSSFLFKIAWIPILVIAGIWGATLSSALGGILGAPRILQAISADKITPGFFAKGHGVGNEPRNALIFTLIISELGVLLGELDTIARVVSMFYIAAYGFINLSFTLEKWASSDFRPSFKVSIWLGIIGVISSFAVMFKLDTVAMIAAFIILFALYFYIRKKKVSLDYGDVWQSVFSSIARTVLSKIDSRKNTNLRNWQPNIILFSGGTNQRPYLIEFGKTLIGKQGLLSNFDLTQNEKAKILFPKTTNSDQNKLKEDGIFTKRQVCKDIYQGIEIIASTYGFSGVEPNTILLGWARQSKEPIKFAQMLKSLSTLDQNILLLDYDKNKGFGKRKQIDIWWRGGGNNGSLVLSLVRFIISSELWENTNVRMMIINPVNDEKILLEQNAKKILESLRISAEIKVINNEIEKRGINEIIKSESIESDLTFLGLPEVIEGKEFDFVKSTNTLCQGIGSVVLVKASSEFKELKIGTSGLNTEITKELSVFNNYIKQSEKSTIKLSYPQKPELLVPIEGLHKKLNDATEAIFQNYFNKVFSFQLQLIDELKSSVLDTYTELLKERTEKLATHERNLMFKKEITATFRIRKSFRTFRQEKISKQEELLQQAIEKYLTELAEIVSQIPEKIRNNLIKDELQENAEDSHHLRKFKRKHLRRLKKKNSSPYDIQYKPFVLNYLPQRNYKILYNLFEELGIKSFHIHLKVLKQSRSIADSFFALNTYFLNKDLKTGINSEIQRLEKQFDDLRDFCKFSYANLNQNIKVENAKIINDLSNDLYPINANDFYKSQRIPTPQRKDLIAEIESLPEKWATNQSYNFNSSILEWTFISFIIKLRGIFDEALFYADIKMFSFISKNQLRLLEELQKISRQLKNDENIQFTYEPEILEEVGGFDNFWKNFFENTFKHVKQATRSFPEKIDLLNNDQNQNFLDYQFKGYKPIQLRVSLLADYIIQNKVFAPLRNDTYELPGILQKAFVQLQDISKNILFAIEENKEKSKSDLLEVVDQKIQELTLEIKSVDEAKTNLHNRIAQHIKSIISELNIQNFSSNSETLKIYIKEQEKIKRNTFLKKIQSYAKKGVGNQITQFWYKRSLGALFTKKIQDYENTQISSVSDLLKVSDSLKIKQEILSQIPFYYHQLFSRKEYYLNDFWVGRKDDLNKAQEGLERYRSGNYGAILILGETDSGKSFFSQYMIQKDFDSSSSNVVTILPPPSGSISTEVFIDTLKRSFEVYGDIDFIFENLQKNSVVILEDLELWWEKSDDGLAIINYIIQLINKFSSKCLFVVTSNIHSYEFINRFQNLDNLFLCKIELGVFHTKQLQEVIMRRHLSSGMTFVLNKRSQNKFHSWNYARLFSKYFSISKGNIGVAMYTWLRSIKKVDGQNIEISIPSLPDTNSLDHLDTESYMLLLQILLHRRVTIDKLQRILIRDKEYCEQRIISLLRAGIISEYRNGIYELFPPLYPIIREKLQTKEIL